MKVFKCWIDSYDEAQFTYSDSGFRVIYGNVIENVLRPMI